MATLSRTIDNVGSAIADIIEPYITDATFEDFALLALLEAKGNVVTPDPGYKISWPVVKAKLNTGSYRGLKRFPGEEKTIFDLATVDWKGIYCDVVVSSQDILRARGPYAAYQLTDALKQASGMSISEEMGTQIYSDGTGSGSDDLDGCAAAIDDGNLTATYGGITRSGLVGWQSYVDGTGALTTLPLITTAIGKATFGQSRPDLAATDQTTWDVLHSRAQTQQVFNAGDSGHNVANMGFDAIIHQGMAIVHDSKCPAGNMFGITCDQVQLAVMRDRVWSWSGWDKIPGADGYEAQYLFFGNFLFHAPRQFFRLYGLT